MSALSNLVQAYSTPTMSSREIAELTGKRHDHVMRDIRIMLLELHGENDLPRFGGVYLGGNGEERPCFNLPRREVEILVTGYSIPLRAKVIDRLHELEGKVVEAPKTRKRIPKPDTETAKIYLLFKKELIKAGVSEGVATAAVLTGMEEATGIPMEPLRKVLPCPTKVCTLNQTELGSLCGVGAVTIGKLLRQHGLMEDDASGERRVTKKGEEFGTMVPFVKNGHSGYEPRWHESVLKVLFAGEEAA